MSTKPPPRSEELDRISRGSWLLEPKRDASGASLLDFEDGVKDAPGAGSAALPVQAMGAFHLTKGIVGTGWLSIPCGVSTLAGAVGEASALPVALMLLAGIAAVSAYTYKAVAEIAVETRSSSFAEAFTQTKAGPISIAAWTTFLNCLSGCVSLAMILGDSGTGMLHQVLSGTSIGDAAILDPELHLTLRFIMVTASCALMWPLCSSLDMRNLGWCSLLGVSATTLTAVVMAVRLLDGSYGPTGAFVGAPSAGAATVIHDPGPLGAVGAVFTLVSLLANSFIAHQCAPQLRQSVEEDYAASSASIKSGRHMPSGVFDGVVNAGFAFSGVLYAVIAVCGFLTFGVGATANVLDGYAAADPMAAAARLATVVCVVCSFPQLLLGLRDSVRDLAGGRKEFEILACTPTLLAAVAVLAGMFTNLSSVMAVQGAVLGSLIVYVLPALMMRGQSSEGAHREESEEFRPDHALLAMGSVIGAGGLGAALAEVSAATV